MAWQDLSKFATDNQAILVSIFIPAVTLIGGWITTQLTLRAQNKSIRLQGKSKLADIEDQRLKELRTAFSEFLEVHGTHRFGVLLDNEHGATQEASIDEIKEHYFRLFHIYTKVRILLLPVSEDVKEWEEIFAKVQKTLQTPNELTPIGLMPFISKVLENRTLDVKRSLLEP